MFRVDAPFPSFKLQAYFPERDETGEISSQQLRGRWYLLFWYPADFTFVCPTELADLARHYEEFKKLRTEIIGASTDTVFVHRAWLKQESMLFQVKYPLAADPAGKLARTLGVYDEENGTAQRAAFVVDPDGTLRAADIVADRIGRNGAEILRKVQALVYTRDHPGKVCPAGWTSGKPALEPSIKLMGRVGEELGGS